MKLKLPPTLSFPTAEDVPEAADLDRLHAARVAARLEPGFVLKPAPEGADFVFYARVNIDAGALWPVFEALVSRMPSPVGMVVRVRDVEPKLLPYAPREAALDALREHERVVCLDPFVECGVIHAVQGRTDEVYIAAAKYLRVWGTDEPGFRALMARFGLSEHPDLRFIDQFPLVSRPLWSIEPALPKADDVARIIAARIEAHKSPSPAAL